MKSHYRLPADCFVISSRGQAPTSSSDPNMQERQGRWSNYQTLQTTTQDGSNNPLSVLVTAFLGLSVWCVKRQCSLFNNKAMPSAFHTSGGWKKEEKRRKKKGGGSEWCIQVALLHFQVFWACKLPINLCHLLVFFFHFLNIYFRECLKTSTFRSLINRVSVRLKAPVCCKWLRNNEAWLMTNNKLILNLALNLIHKKREGTRQSWEHKKSWIIKGVWLFFFLNNLYVYCQSRTRPNTL